MPNSSSETVRLHAPLRNAIVAIHDEGATRRPHRIDIKEIQRRAYERGVTSERERSSAALEALMNDLLADVRAQTARGEDDHGRIEEFATRLGLMIAEKLVGRIIEEGSHDVPAMVHEALDHIADADRKSGVTVRLHPDDVSALMGAIAGGAFPGDEVEVVSDQRLARGSFAVAAGECELLASMIDRVEQLRSRLIEEARRDPS